MNHSTHFQNLRITLIGLFSLILMISPLEGISEEFSVPNHGSPYKNLGDLELDQILHVPTGVIVSQREMMESISASRVIYVGETHDNIEAHKVQLKIIQALSKKYQVAVGLEMFRRSSQSDLDLWNSGQLSIKDFKNLFHSNWGGGFDLYQPIFEFAKSNRIPLIGLKSSQKVEKSFRSGDPAPDDTLYPEIDYTDPYHRAYSMAAFGGHRGTAKALEKPYRMLLLWEETMAQVVSQFLRNFSNKEKKLIVLAGGFHVQYGFGIPKRAYRRIPHNYSIILPDITEVPEGFKEREMTVEKTSIPLYSSDYAWKVEYQIPSQNKVKLGVQLTEAKSEGVLVKFVGNNSNAKNGGMQPGDLLTKMDGIALKGVKDVLRILQSKNFEDKSSFDLLRDKKPLKIEILFKRTR